MGGHSSREEGEERDVLTYFLHCLHDRLRASRHLLLKADMRGHASRERNSTGSAGLETQCDNSV